MDAGYVAGEREEENKRLCIVNSLSLRNILDGEFHGARIDYKKLRSTLDNVHSHAGYVYVHPPLMLAFSSLPERIQAMIAAADFTLALCGFLHERMYEILGKYPPPAATQIVIASNSYSKKSCDLLSRYASRGTHIYIVAKENAALPENKLSVYAEAMITRPRTASYFHFIELSTLVRRFQIMNTDRRVSSGKR